MASIREQDKRGKRLNATLNGALLLTMRLGIAASPIVMGQAIPEYAKELPETVKPVGSDQRIYPNMLRLLHTGTRASVLPNLIQEYRLR